MLIITKFLFNEKQWISKALQDAKERATRYGSLLYFLDILSNTNIAIASVEYWYYAKRP